MPTLTDIAGTVISSGMTILLPLVPVLLLAGCVAQPASKPAATAGAGEQVVTTQTVASNAEAAALV